MQQHLFPAWAHAYRCHVSTVQICSYAVHIYHVWNGNNFKKVLKKKYVIFIREMTSLWVKAENSDSAMSDHSWKIICFPQICLTLPLLNCQPKRYRDITFIMFTQPPSLSVPFRGSLFILGDRYSEPSGHCPDKQLYRTLPE